MFSLTDIDVIIMFILVTMFVGFHNHIIFAALDPFANLTFIWFLNVLVGIYIFVFLDETANGFVEFF